MEKGAVKRGFGLNRNEGTAGEGTEERHFQATGRGISLEMPSNLLNPSEFFVRVSYATLSRKCSKHFSL